MLLSLDRLAALKDAAQDCLPNIKSSHLTEILAAGFGFGSNAALRQKLRTNDDSSEETWSNAKAAARAAELGYEFPGLPDSLFEWVERDNQLRVEIFDQEGAIVWMKRERDADKAWHLFTKQLPSCNKGWKIGLRADGQEGGYVFLYECLYKADLTTVDLSDQLRIFGLRRSGQSYEKRYAQTLKEAWRQLGDITRYLAIGEQTFVRPVFGDDLIGFRCLEGHSS